MAATLSVYSFQDPEGNEYGSFTTQDFAEARNYAMNANLQVIENVYEWSEAIPVEGADFTETNEEGDEPQPSPPCQECGYVLGSSGPDDPCPECGYVVTKTPPMTECEYAYGQDAATATGMYDD